MSRRLRLLLWSLVVAVTALSSVGFFAERVERALNAEGAAMLAADLVVTQGRPAPQAWIEQAHRLGLQASELVEFPSVLFINEAPQLVQVKAVQAGYPLRGTLRLDTPAGEQQQPPQPGEAALAQRLALLLGEGATTIELGELELRIKGEVVEEPDLRASLFQLAPRLLVSWQDAHASGLLGPASRARYRLLLAGEASQLQAFRAWLAPRLPNAARLVDQANGRPEVSSAIDRGRRFLSLAALCASLVAGVAIMLATRRFVALVLDEVAVLRTIGMTSWQVLWRYLRQLLGVTLVGAVLGVGLGYLAQSLLVAVFADWLGSDLPAPGWRPLGMALAHALILVLGFALPSLLAIRRVPPLRVLRRELGVAGIPQGVAALLALAAYTLLVYWQVDDAAMAGLMSVGLAGVLLVYAAVAFVLLRLLRPLRRHGGLAVGLAALARQPGLTLMQLAGFGLGITLLLLLTLVRIDILDAWQKSLPADTPNYFLINIQPDEVEPLRELLAQHGISGSGFHPTTRARLLQINGADIDPEQFAEGRARRLASREYSLGFGDLMQADNRVLAGRWWQAGERGFSVEQGLAETLGIGPGDVLSFDVAGQTLSAPVRNLRSVSWDSFNVNFFVQGSTSLLQGVPYAVISSVHLGDGQKDVLRQLTRDYPAVSAVSLGPLLDKVRGIIQRGALAIEGVFLFTLAAAVLVSLAAVQISREQREREIALLRTFGASRRRVLQLVLAEFAALGLIAGVISALLANLLSMLLAQRLFDLHTGFNGLLWLGGSLLGVLVVGLVGYLASRPVLRTPPMQLLR